MEFEVGKSYKRRDGKAARLVAHVPEATYLQRLVWVCCGYLYATGEDGASFNGEDSCADVLPPEPDRVMVQRWVTNSGYVHEALVGSKLEEDYRDRSPNYTKLGHPYEVK